MVGAGKGGTSEGMQRRFIFSFGYCSCCCLSQQERGGYIYLAFLVSFAMMMMMMMMLLIGFAAGLFPGVSSFSNVRGWEKKRGGGVMAVAAGSALGEYMLFLLLKKIFS